MPSREISGALDKRKILRNLEGDYLLDYAIFTGAVRVYVTTGLEEHFARDKNDLHRRMFLLAVYREEYSAYEDLGALLDAILTHRQNAECPLIERLISYRVVEVKLSKVMERFQIADSHQLHDKLGLQELIPSDWPTEFPTLNLKKALRVAANYFFVDCQKSQKEEGLRAFNKMKHGLLLVPKASIYLKQQIDAPAALFVTDEKKDEAAANPLSLYSVPMSDDHLDARLRAIHFVQANLRMIAALWVVTKYPEVVQRRGMKRPLDLLRTVYLTDVLNFLEEVSKDTDASAAAPAG